jgi:hypothetical protein
MLMSFDLGVWYPHERLTNAEAGNLYVSLCDGTAEPRKPHPAIDNFYHELTAKHPEIDDVPEDRIGDFEFSPWSCSFDRSPGHLIMSCVWPKADYVDALVKQLARKHGLAVYDSQSERIFYPDDTDYVAPNKPWWKFW